MEAASGRLHNRWEPPGGMDALSWMNLGLCIYAWKPCKNNIKVHMGIHITKQCKYLNPKNNIKAKNKHTFTYTQQFTYIILFLHNKNSNTMQLNGGGLRAPQ